MKVLVFDTETTGVLPKPRPSYTCSHYYPYIVQLSYILYDTKYNIVLDNYDTIVAVPPSVVIPDEAAKIHGITTLMSRENGADILEVLSILYKAFSKADVIVGHNISFDIHMIIAESIRNLPKLKAQNIYDFHNGGPFIAKFRTKTQYCTMKMGINICNIMVESTWDNGKTLYAKWPTLAELYKKLYDETVENTHNSMVDIIMTLRCFCCIHEEIQHDPFEKSTQIRELYDLFCIEAS